MWRADGSAARERPAPGPWPRPALEHRLDRATTHRLTVIAGPRGVGRTSVLRRWSAELPAAWLELTADHRDVTTLAAAVTDALRPRAAGLSLRPAHDAPVGPTGLDDTARAASLAGRLCGSMATELPLGTVLVLDDVHVVDGARGAVRFLETLVRTAPPLLHVVLSTRTGVPFSVDRLRARGHVLDIDGRALALDPETTRSWTVAQLGCGAERLAPVLHERTGGWAVAVRAAIEALRDVPLADRDGHLRDLLAGPPFAELWDRVLADEGPCARTLLHTVAPLPWFTTALCVELGLTDADAVLASLARRGLFVEPAPADPEGIRLTGLARGRLAGAAPLAPDERARVLAVAARHWRAAGRHAAALRCLVDAGDATAVAATLRAHGTELATADNLELLGRAEALLPPEPADLDLERVLGVVARARGDWDEARRRFERAAAAVPDGAPLDAGLAWRLGLVHHFRGDLDRALAVYGRGAVDEPSPESAVLLSWTGAVHWLRGDLEAASALAARSLEHASAADDQRALSAAHTLLAMVADLAGDRRANRAQYRRALELADASGDVLQSTRIRVNLASHLLEEGQWEAALAELDVALSAAEATGYPTIAALGFTNRGWASLRLGRLEEAADDLEVAIGIWRLVGSRVAYPLNHLGELHLLRGDRDRAIAAHTEALASGRSHGDVQSRLPALTGLASAHLDVEPERARSLAEEAVALGGSLGLVEALVVAGRAAAACGDTAAATTYALRAADAARERGDRLGLAAALQLRASLETPRTAASLLDEAVELCAAVGDPIALARAELARAATYEPALASTIARSVRDRMRAIGCRRLADRAEALLRTADGGRAVPPVEVGLLGTFRLLVGGRHVPIGDWGSRKARDLFKILVVCRGRPVPRGQVVALLWPGESLDSLGNRLNVAVSVVRGILDPDRCHDSDRWVVSEDDALRLRQDGLEVDVDRFLADATEGRRLRRRGHARAGALLLRRAEWAYVGDVLEEDVYEQWAAPLREEARACYLAVARELAADERSRGRTDDAVRYLLRVLAHDPYDERAHLELVTVLDRAGRHGEARRRYRAYEQAMGQLGVEPAPFPSH